MFRKAVEVINEHPADDPLFLYLAYQTAHMPVQVEEMPQICRIFID